MYGAIAEKNLLEEYRKDKPLIKYIKLQIKGDVIDQHISLTDYIRHQIHHPENTKNRRYTQEELRESICMMRDFIEKMCEVERAKE